MEQDVEIARRIGNVKPSAIRELLKLATRPGMISFAGGLPAQDCIDLSGLTEATARAMADPKIRALQYGITEGDPEFVEALAPYLHGSKSLPAGQKILMTSGSHQAIDIVCRTLLNAGDTVLVESPTYMAALQTLGMAEANIVGLAERVDGTFDLDDLEQKVREHKPKVFYVLPTFSNPSGRCLSEADRQGILELAQKYKFWILEDDPYRELYFGVPPPPSIFWLAAHTGIGTDWCLYMSGASKVLAPGLRLGWLAAPDRVLGPLVISKQASDLQAPSISQRIALEYLRSGKITTHLDVVRKRYELRAMCMSSALEEELRDSLEWRLPVGGMFLWARLKTKSSDRLLEHAIDTGVLFLPGESMFASKPASQWMRLSYASASNEQVIEGVSRLAKALRSAR